MGLREAAPSSYRVESGFEPRAADSKLILVTRMLGSLVKRTSLHSRDLYLKAVFPVMKSAPTKHSSFLFFFFF